MNGKIALLQAFSFPHLYSGDWFLKCVDKNEMVENNWDHCCTHAAYTAMDEWFSELLHHQSCSPTTPSQLDESTVTRNAFLVFLLAKLTVWFQNTITDLHSIIILKYWSWLVSFEGPFVDVSKAQQRRWTCSNRSWPAWRSCGWDGVQRVLWTGTEFTTGTFLKATDFEQSFSTGAMAIMAIIKKPRLVDSSNHL